MIDGAGLTDLSEAACEWSSPVAVSRLRNEMTTREPIYTVSSVQCPCGWSARCVGKHEAWILFASHNCVEKEEMTESEYIFVCNCIRVRTALTLLTECLPFDERVREAISLLSAVQQNDFLKLEEMVMAE